MSEKIYEYKDKDNWFIGKMTGHNMVSGWGVDQMMVKKIDDLLDGISTELDWENPKGYDVSVLRYQSPFSLLSFIVDMINQETKREIKVDRHAGAISLSEDEKLLAVYLPEGGVSMAAFFPDSRKGVGETILIATRNEGKTKEFRRLFADLGYRVENLNDYPDLPEVAETGVTFEENARLKAETISHLTGKMVLADDSGLKVDALGGLPGVWSARFSGPDATDDRNNAKLLHELAMVFDQKDRSAQFHSTLVVAAPDKESLVVEADWPGYIAFQPKGNHGFGYDPLFIVGETGRHAAELEAEEKNQLSHRGQAVRKLMEVFPSWQAKQL
ncbi:nucleoside-triphosphate diphosphatase [Streptococcus porcinus]|uniref:dITP/XTP pyrophosphatase n=1 Tax=Streptococcus porcinus TaxID=1340 RepID=A0A7V9WST8_STRPO|nr:nucleoside-triphosphate diphosphatase [Streptococcus porcinus]MBA2796435.1 nucleoside-triphosphate diphosphatase [Streptococcus porcinus]